MLCQGKEREYTPRLFNVFLMFLAERLFFDMLSLPTGANAARVSWLAGCRLAHTRVPSFLRSLVYLCHSPGLLRNFHTRTSTREVSISNKTKQNKTKQNKTKQTPRQMRFLHVSVAPRLVCRMTFILCLSGNPTPSGSSILD